MASYRKVGSLAATDAAYVAGIVDGEGTITLARKHAGEHRQLVVSISSTERPILEYVLDRVKAGKITSKKTAQPHHAPSLTYSIWNRQALDLLAQIAPFLRSYKRMRADLVEQNYVRLTPRNGKYTPAMREARLVFETAVLAVRANGVATLAPPAEQRAEYAADQRAAGLRAD